MFASVGHNSRLRLLGISTVAGNQTVDKVTINALGVTDAAGLQRVSAYANAVPAATSVPR